MHDGLEMSFALSALPRAATHPWRRDPRAAIEGVGALGYRALQLDVTVPGLRPRDLGRSARRDLAALLRRARLGSSGFDLLIPPTEFAGPATADRALAAAVGAMELAAELSGLLDAPPGAAPVCLELPADARPDIPAALRERAFALGVRVADLAWPPREPTMQGDALASGIDPARAILAGADPVAAVARLGAGVAAARLTDTDGVGRIPPLTGRGRLDLLAYRVALAASGFRGAVVADLRAVTGWEPAARSLPTAWRAMV